MGYVFSAQSPSTSKVDHFFALLTQGGYLLKRSGGVLRKVLAETFPGMLKDKPSGPGVARVSWELC